MRGSKQSKFQARPLLLAILTGAVIAVASAVAYSNSGQQMPVVANIAVSTISLAVFPGYILSAYISNNIHDANLILAGFINFILYGGLSLWLLTWRDRRRSVSQSLLTSPQAVPSGRPCCIWAFIRELFRPEAKTTLLRIGCRVTRHPRMGAVEQP